MSEQNIADHAAKSEKALELIYASMERNGVVVLGGLARDGEGHRIGVTLFTRGVTLQGTGISMSLSPGLYGYGGEPGDNWFYSIPDIVVLKGPDAADTGEGEPDPYPDYDAVWNVTTKRVGAQLEDGSSIELTFTRVYASMAIAHALQDGREEDAQTLEDWYAISAKEDSADGTDADNRPNAPELEAIVPHRHYSPNAKTTEVLTKPVLFEGLACLDVGGKRGQLTIDFGLGWADGEAPANIDITQPIDKEDVRVIAAVVTLKKAGNATVSPFQIAETMGYGMPTVELQREIHERVMKLRQIDGRIDWTEQARHYKFNNPETGLPYERAEISGHLIDCVVFDGTDVNGNRYIRYQLLSDPITYQHAHQIGQVIDYPQRLLGLKPITESGARKKRVTREQTQVADSVLWFVYSLRSPRNHMNETIRYDTLFERAGVDASHYKKRQRLVVFVNDYLRALQHEGVIRGFEVNAPGRSHRPVSVSVAVQKDGSMSKRGRR